MVCPTRTLFTVLLSNSVFDINKRITITDITDANTQYQSIVSSNNSHFF